jgi:hypothetical protein
MGPVMTVMMMRRGKRRGGEREHAAEQKEFLHSMRMARKSIDCPQKSD